jgi:hypothetical protein
LQIFKAAIQIITTVVFDTGLFDTSYIGLQVLRVDLSRYHLLGVFCRLAIWNVGTVKIHLQFSIFLNFGQSVQNEFIELLSVRLAKIGHDQVFGDQVILVILFVIFCLKKAEQDL